MGITTSGRYVLFYSVDADKAQRIRLGVAGFSGLFWLILIQMEQLHRWFW